MNLLRISEAAAALRVSESTIYRLLDRGRLHRVQVLDRSTRVSEESVQEYVRNGGEAA